MQDYESESIYYNRDTNSYCYIGTEKPNHDSVIVGWDDDFPKENFNMDLEGDGAFICTNSWGEDFGDRGYFYVSYYDTNIGVHNIVYTGIEPTDNYDKIYQSDLCGWSGSDRVWERYSLVCQCLSHRRKGRAGGSQFFMQQGRIQNIKIYVARYLPDKDGSDAAGKDRFSQDHGLESALNRRTLLAEGVLEYSGYYTIPFDRKIVLDQEKVCYNSGNKNAGYYSSCSY